MFTSLPPLLGQRICSFSIVRSKGSREQAVLCVCPLPQPTATAHFYSHQSPPACPQDQGELYLMPCSHSLFSTIEQKIIETRFPSQNIVRLSSWNQGLFLINHHIFVKIFLQEAEINFNNGRHLDWELEEEEKRCNCLNYFLPFVTTFFLS